MRRIEEFACTSVSVNCAPAGTPTSERTERISETSSTIQPISASAALSIGKSDRGHGPSASAPARGGPCSPLIAQSSSVTKGMNGCSSA